MSQKFCSINQNENKKQKLSRTAFKWDRTPNSTSNTLTEICIWWASHMLQKTWDGDSERQAARQGEWDKEGPQQKVSTAKGATAEQVKRKTIANYGSSDSGPFACLPLLSTPGNTLSQHKNRKQKKNPKGRAGKNYEENHFCAHKFQ